MNSIWVLINETNFIFPHNKNKYPTNLNFYNQTFKLLYIIKSFDKMCVIVFKMQYFLFFHLNT
jgi:hypothetical protein